MMASAAAWWDKELLNTNFKLMHWCFKLRYQLMGARPNGTFVVRSKPFGHDPVCSSIIIPSLSWSQKKVEKSVQIYTQKEIINVTPAVALNVRQRVLAVRMTVGVEVNEARWNLPIYSPTVTRLRICLKIELYFLQYESFRLTFQGGLIVAWKPRRGVGVESYYLPCIWWGVLSYQNRTNGESPTHHLSYYASHQVRDNKKLAYLRCQHPMFQSFPLLSMVVPVGIKKGIKMDLTVSNIVLLRWLSHWNTTTVLSGSKWLISSWYEKQVGDACYGRHPRA